MIIFLKFYNLLLCLSGICLDHDLFLHTAYVVCVNFYARLAGQHKVDIHLFALRVFARSLLKGRFRRNIFPFCFVLMPELGFEP